MYIELIGDIQASLNVRYLPEIGDIICVRGNFYRVLMRFYNTDIEEWVLNIDRVRVNPSVTNLWKTKDENLA